MYTATQPPYESTTEAYRVIIRMLSGQRPILNTIYNLGPPITDDTLAKWWKPATSSPVRMPLRASIRRPGCRPPHSTSTSTTARRSPALATECDARPLRGRASRLRRFWTFLMSTIPADNTDPATYARGVASWRASALRKSFGPTRALVDVTIEVAAGRIIGVVGENGYWQEHTCQDPERDPAARRRRPRGRGSEYVVDPEPHGGLATRDRHRLSGDSRRTTRLGARQHLPRSRRCSCGLATTRASAGDVPIRRLSAICSVPIDLDTPVELLTLSQQQLVVIARALVREPRILILDESTSALDIRDRDRLFEHCRSLRDRGCAIIFITHRLEELLASPTGWSSSATARRSGDFRSSSPTRQDPRIDDQGGRCEDGRRRGRRAAASRRRAGASILTTSKSAAEHPSRGSSRPAPSWGSRVWRGTARSASSRARGTRAADPGHRRGRGRHAAPRHSLPLRCRPRRNRLPPAQPRDPRHFPSLSILDNSALPTLHRSQRFGVISMRRLRRRFTQAQRQLSIRFSSMRDPITSLSGGNRRKVLIARWLAAEPRVILLDDPTRGVDLPTKVELHELLRDQARAGCGVVLLTTDLEARGRLRCSACLPRGHHRRPAGGGVADRDAVLEAMFGPTA